MKFYEFNLCRFTCVKDKIAFKTKLITVLVFSLSVQVNASVLAQITLSEKNAPLETVLEKIGVQSDYDIIFNSNLIKKARPVTVDAKNAPLLGVLAECFVNQPLSYTVSSLTIIVNDKKNVDITVTGTVKDALGKPVPGASVIVKGIKGRGTSTNANGNFSLSVPENAVLVVSALGFTPMEVPVNNRKTIEIVITEEKNDLNEVVVVGYGTIEKKDLTSAVSTIKPKDFISGSVNPLLSIQGKVPGLTISSSNGSDPNANVTVQLRGVNSINAGQGPLIVIDGVPGGSINSVAREDIESINVLRDASAAAIYGTRASGGVILVTTKRAKVGPANITFTTELFTESIRRRPESLSGDEFIEKGLGTDFGSRTDWYQEVTNKSPFSQRYVLNANGGSENAQVYSTVTMRNAKGIAIGSDRKEIGGRINTIFKFFDGKAQLSTNVSYNHVDANLTDNNIFNMALVLNPTQSPYDPNDITGLNVMVGGYDYWNPVAEVRLRKEQRQNKYLLASSVLKVDLTKDLYTSAMVAVKNNSENPIYYRSSQHRISRTDGVDGYAKQEYKRYTDRTFEWTANYNKVIDNHSINAVAGYSYQDFNGQGFMAENSDFSVDGIGENDMNNGTFLTDGRANMTSFKDPAVKLIAFFGRVNYSFMNRYIVTGTLRREGSSKFAPGKRWGTFPGVSLAWRISEEPFMKSLKFINDLKIRGGYGETGNADFDANVAYRMYAPDAWWLVDGQWQRTYGVRHNQNPNLKWEVKKEFSVGMDFALLNNKITGRLDFYKRKVDDIIYNINVSQPPAIYETTTVNIGSMQNKGFEVELNWNAIDRDDFKYTTGVVMSGNKSSLTTLSGSQTFADRMGFPAPGSPGNAVRLFPGHDIGEFFLWRSAGFTPEGNWMLYDKDGQAFDVTKRSKTIADKAFVGNAIPKVILSWSHSVAYKNFDAGIYLRSWLGYDVFNMINMYYSLPNVQGQNVLREAYEKHKDIKGEKELSDYWLEKGDFLKVDAISLGYTFKQNLIKSLKNLRIYATGRDLFVLTRYSGLDPEVNINGLDPGFEERNAYPKTRTFMFGVQVGF
ncbi:SusC/RagA family TonB-linked outer membrane protein [Pedobacter sp. PLR]|uniref:SusC/RagA family TonB-linked outer membrane protein n=1 Tax=Pedobacter sp. PLR TaxID=2994465 RepID=UPI0022485CCE|nr:SusC/RagA family TonB-linked outer membrane protein [Pedobacter sp. PLR]MCX2449768.1 SusC/RagA family TonB-linked outer membrane protein [Pedobacter sp. PLR]